MDRETWPLIGTVTMGPVVYEVRKGPYHPVTIWRGDDEDSCGYVRLNEYQLALEGHIPNVVITGMQRCRLHFPLRKAVGELVRTPDPTRKIVLDEMRTR